MIDVGAVTLIIIRSEVARVGSSMRLTFILGKSPLIRAFKLAS